MLVELPLDHHYDDQDIAGQPQEEQQEDNGCQGVPGGSVTLHHWVQAPHLLCQSVA